jgi:hypothetical protein
MYKVIQDGQVIDVISNPNFVKFLPSGHIAFTDKSSAHGVLGSDNKTVYSLDSTLTNVASVVKICEVSLQEFNRLKGLLNSAKKPATSERALIAARESKIIELSTICKDSIIDGFSIILGNGKVYCFRLTVEDQLNLISIENQLNSGIETFVYHATNQPCRCFSRIDMAKIINASKRHISYHTTYFNVAKQYINSLTDVDKVNAFYYGADISNTVDDVVIKQILKNKNILKRRNAVCCQRNPHPHKKP